MRTHHPYHMKRQQQQQHHKGRRKKQNKTKIKTNKILRWSNSWASYGEINCVSTSTVRPSDWWLYDGNREIYSGRKRLISRKFKIQKRYRFYRTNFNWIVLLVFFFSSVCTVYATGLFWFKKKEDSKKGERDSSGWYLHWSWIQFPQNRLKAS